MLPTFKAEFRKLFTVRSTYVTIFLAFALSALFSFYFEGYRGNTGSAASLLEPTALKEIVSNAAGLGVLFVSIITALYMAHEYRYNTIMFTLTANSKRTEVFVTKLFVAAVFGIIFGLAYIGFTIACYMLGLALRGAELPPQDFKAMTELSAVAFYYMAYALVGMLISALTRNVIAAIAFLLIFPITVEPLLGVILKDNSKYLPFSALDATVGTGINQGMLNQSTAVLVSAGYLLVVALITWLMFIRRDAN